MGQLMLLWLLLAPGPDHILTPGLTRPLSQAAVCQTTWSADRRHVTENMKRQVAASYGIPWETRGRYEFDHLIPRELGGADAVLNLWPQPWPEARQKDRLENALHRAVCRDAMTLDFAQEAIRTNWRAAYRLYVTSASGGSPPAPR